MAQWRHSSDISGWSSARTTRFSWRVCVAPKPNSTLLRTGRRNCGLQRRSEIWGLRTPLVSVEHWFSITTDWSGQWSVVSGCWFVSDLFWPSSIIVQHYAPSLFRRPRLIRRSGVVNIRSARRFYLPASSHKCFVRRPGLLLLVNRIDYVPPIFDYTTVGPVFCRLLRFMRVKAGFVTVDSGCSQAP